LCEVVIVRQNFLYAALAHDVYRDAIGEAVAFVKARFVKRKSGEKSIIRTFSVSD